MVIFSYLKVCMGAARKNFEKQKKTNIHLFLVLYQLVMSKFKNF